MSWKTDSIDILSILEQTPAPRAQKIATLITGGKIKIKKEMSVRELIKLARIAPSAVQRDDCEYVLKMISGTAFGNAAARRRVPTADLYNPDYLNITYIALNQSLDIPGALLSFDDNYRPSFRREEVYGRMDPIATYQGTTRNIGLEWEMNIASAATPELNLAAFQDLIKFMYPVYQDTTYNQLGTGTLVAPPVLRIEIQNGAAGRAGLFQGYNKGVLCIVDSFSYSRFAASAAGGEINIQRAPSPKDANDFNVRPTHLTISLQLTVLHEEAKVGFVYSKEDNDVAIKFGQGEDYPYGFGTTLNLSETPPSRIAAAESEIKALQDTAGANRQQTTAEVDEEKRRTDQVLV